MRARRSLPTGILTMPLKMIGGALLAHYFGGRLALTEDEDICDCECGIFSCCELLFSPYTRAYEVTVAGYSFTVGFGKNDAFILSRQRSIDNGDDYLSCMVSLSNDTDAVVVTLTWEATTADPNSDLGRWVFRMSDENAVYFWVSEEMSCHTAFDTTIELFHTLEFGGTTPPGTGTVHVEPLGVL